MKDFLATTVLIASCIFSGTAMAVVFNLSPFTLSQGSPTILSIPAAMSLPSSVTISWTMTRTLNLSAINTTGSSVMVGVPVPLSATASAIFDFSVSSSLFNDVHILTTPGFSGMLGSSVPPTPILLASVGGTYSNSMTFCSDSSCSNAVSSAVL